MDATGKLQRGYFLLADLSGYTAYLAGSEPTHGPLIAADFIETMVGRLRGSFALQKLEGDAAFLFAPADRVSGTQLLDAVDAAYFAFQRRVQSVSQATACACQACQRIPQLDLKFVCHVGDALHQRIAGRDELAGRDVIVAHRLLKGTSTERAGAHSYLLLSDAAMMALDLEPAALGMVSLTERYDELGPINCHLLDLARRWEREQQSGVAPRPSGKPLARIERLLPAAPTVAWELLTSPDRRMGWEGIATVDEATPGQRGIGTTASCVVGRLRMIEEIVDWRPYESFARSVKHPALGRLTALYRLTEMGTGTHLEVTWFAGSRRNGDPATRAAAATFMSDQADALDRLVEAAEESAAYDGALTTSASSLP